MENETTYIQGFNSGFKLAQYNPELWEKLKPSLSLEAGDYERGVLEGAEEYGRSKAKGREQDLDNIRSNKAQSKDKDIER